MPRLVNQYAGLTGAQQVATSGSIMALQGHQNSNKDEIGNEKSSEVYKLLPEK